MCITTVWQAFFAGIQSALPPHSSMLITQQNTQDRETGRIHPKVKLHTDFKRKPPR